ncbi:cytochrome c6 PetJ [Nostoc sp. TCL26-01]|uniref:cytochrome c6 PetJ n=1 Tax=Nostoc sp. TCL26-01 TaxID=2576904 RepID=UPI0015B7A770|nr:c-type cytochrome [Nostoc sp. TCL26-01]QLE56989.1 c-type cytochrome [Nostoc sp. TCL26-01]
MEKLVKLVLVTILLLISTVSLPAIAQDKPDGAQIFSVHCAGCHINGGNIIRRGKNLQKKALKKYGMDSLAAVQSIVTNGKNNMSAYKDRLRVEEIQAVASYVLEQAEKGWR